MARIPIVIVLATLLLANSTLPSADGPVLQLSCYRSAATAAHRLRFDVRAGNPEIFGGTLSSDVPGIACGADCDELRCRTRDRSHGSVPDAGLRVTAGMELPS